MSDIAWYTTGSYKCVAMHNLEDFHESIGMPPPMSEAIKKNANQMRCTCVLEGEDYVLTMNMAPGTPDHVQRFRLGVEFSGKDLMGNDSVTIVTNENGTIREVLKTDKYSIETTKSLQDGKMIMKVESKGFKDASSWSEWEKC